MTTGIVILLLLLVAGLLIWILYQSSGLLRAVTYLSPTGVLDEVVDLFAVNDWTVQHKARDFVVLKKSPSGVAGCLLLVLFFPVGLAYLLTDWGTGKTTVRVWENNQGATKVEIVWQNAGIRRQVEEAIHWLKEQEKR
ncbi:MAG: hypothetical protein MUP14_04740 [Dehalococcoidia bacterium]|nr:hypothetical protein [Dehalococcoidia bacterium]